MVASERIRSYDSVRVMSPNLKLRECARLENGAMNDLVQLGAVVEPPLVIMKELGRVLDLSESRPCRNKLRAKLVQCCTYAITTLCLLG